MILAALDNLGFKQIAAENVDNNLRRIANLLQISSAFGRAMESVDRARICAAIYPALRAHPSPEHAIAMPS